MRFNPAPIKGRKLLTRYVHNSNVVIQPTAMDINTGVFTTAEPHGLSVNNTLLLNFNGDTYLKYAPVEFFTDANSLVVNSVVSSTEFTIKKGSTALLAYTNAGNTEINISKFHFEKPNGTLTFSNINSKRLEVVARGVAERGDMQIKPDITGEINILNGTMVMNSGVGLYVSSNATHHIFRPFQLILGIIIDDDRRVHSYAEIQQVIPNPSRGFDGKDVVKKAGSSRYIISVNKVQTVTTQQAFMNGTIFEFYDLGE